MTHQRLCKILFGMILLLPVGLVQAAPSHTWNFKVFLGEQEIGQHRFEVFTQDSKQYVAIEAKFNVRFLFFSAYSYLHSNYEVWHGECLNTITSKTDDNGEAQFVQGERTGDVLRVTTQSGKEVLRGCVKTFAYWDPAILTSHALLNAQTGELLPVSVADLGANTIEVHGKPVSASQYRLVTDKFSIDLWYSPQREWLALQSTTRDGNVLRYQLQ